MTEQIGGFISRGSFDDLGGMDLNKDIINILISRLDSQKHSYRSFMIKTTVRQPKRIRLK